MQFLFFFFLSMKKYISLKPKSRGLMLGFKPHQSCGGAHWLRGRDCFKNPDFATDSFLTESNWAWLLMLKYGAFSDARNPEEPGQRLGTPQLKLIVFKFQVLHMFFCFCFHLLRFLLAFYTVWSVPVLVNSSCSWPARDGEKPRSGIYLDWLENQS